MDTTSTPRPFGQQIAGATDQAADTASSAIRSTQNVTNEAFDRLSDKVGEVRDQAGPAVSRLTTQAEALAKRGVEAVRDTSAQLREKALQATDTTVGYIKDEPVKSMLIAAATGAALMGLVGLMTRSRRDD